MAQRQSSSFPSIKLLRTMSSSAAASTSDPATTLLQEEKCVPCRKGAPKLPSSEIESLHTSTLLKTHGWLISTRPILSSQEEAGSVPVLEKPYAFKNFKTALAFVNAIGAIAEEEKHHPEILLEWGAVKVAWWTHAIQGVSGKSGTRHRGGG